MHCYIIALLTSCLLLAITGCRKATPGQDADIKWQDLLRQIADTAQISRMDTPVCSMISSADLTGQNNDHSNYIREDPGGWAVIADINGPGYISHIWLTGFDDAWDTKLRIYLDNARRPLEISFKDFFGGKPPFLPPLASREQGCWSSYIPIPYSERIVITTPYLSPDGKTFPLFFQINYCTYPEKTSLQTFPIRFTASDLAAAQEAANALHNINTSSALIPQETKVVLKPNSTSSLDQILGPAIIEKLEITPDLSTVPSATKREHLLRDIILQITWNDSTCPGINTPLGDFFGSIWRRTRFKTLFTGMEADTFYSRMPMPFEKSALIQLLNDSTIDLPVTVRTFTKALPSWDNKRGYLHAVWNKSRPQDIGKPHTILSTGGRGKYVGCFLSMSSMEQSWWALESNIDMYRDNEFHPSWRGTGLEDHFNGGWYYWNPAIRPLSGLSYMAPFRTIQYRFHPTDPFTFDTSTEVFLERGPGNRNKVWYESTAYYYLTEPRESKSNLITSEDRLPPPDPFAQMTLMKQLINQERIGDLLGASDHISDFLEEYPDSPNADMLRLRQIAYREEQAGFAKVENEYRQFVSTSTNEYSVNEARKILWYHESMTNALLIVYCNAKSVIYLDGKSLVQVDNPERAFAIPVTLTPGKHVLCVQAQAIRALPWIQIAMRTHKNNILSSSDWKLLETNGTDFHKPGYNDKEWKNAQIFSKGPPETPFIQLYPNPYVILQSASHGLWVPAGNGTTPVVTFRKEFTF